MAPMRLLTSGFLRASKSTLSWSRTLFASLPDRLDGAPLKIHYETSGKGEHPVLLLPGALGSARTDFAPQLDLMKDDVNLGLVAWDPRGYGNSRPPDRTFPSAREFFAQDADDAVALMKQLQLEPFSLLGWSDGGITAMFIAAKYPESIRKMVVWGSNAYVSEADINMYESIRDVDKWSERMKKPMIELYGEDYFKRCWEDWVDCFKRVYCENKGNICRELLADITCPTLIIHGDKDPMVGDEHPQFLLTNIKNSKLINVTEGKHNLHLKYANEFNKRVKYFLLNG